MLAALLLTSFVVLLFTTAFVFVPGGRQRRPASRASAVVGSAATGLCASAVAVVLRVPTSTAMAVGAITVTAGLPWLHVTRFWNVRGHAAWSSLVCSGCAYLAYMLDWTFRADLGVSGTIGGLSCYRSKPQASCSVPCTAGN